MGNKKTIILLIAMLLAVVPLSAQIHGHIIDDETGDSIPYASVIYKGHNVAVASNLGGYYSIACHAGWKLTFSSVGYQSRTITVKESDNGKLDIRLKPDTRTLTGVTVKAKRRKYSRKNNPAVELMQKVIAAKKKTDLDNRDYYQYNKYQKITLAFNEVNNDTLNSPRFKKWPWLRNYVEKCQYNGKMILPVNVTETLTQKLYRKDPKSEKSIIKGENSSGVNDLFQTGDILTVTLKDVFTDVNIYDDQVRLLQYPFTSPIGKNAIGFYRYYIEDTLYVDNDKCIHLHFLPNNQQDFGFRGDIYILADSSYQVKRCELTIPKRSDVNFVENLRVLQEFRQLPDSTWVLTQDDMIAELKFAKFMQKAIVIRNTRMSDYAFDPLPKQLFKGKTKEVKEADAQMRDEAFWQQYRQVSLSKGESSMDALVHNLEQIKGFKYVIFVMKALIENFVETGNPSKVDIGPCNTIITSNFIDGLRLRGSAQTTAKLNKHWFFSGYYAHGFKSKREYYKADVTYSFNEKEYLPREFPKRTLSFSSTYDVCSPSDKFMHTDKDNMLTAFKWTNAEAMMFYNRQEITFEREEDWGFRTIVSAKTEENEACGAMAFAPLDEGGNKRIRTTELRAELRFAPGETYINTKQRRLKINLDAPVYTISHTIGFKGLFGGDYNYHYTEASIYKRFWMNSWGKIDCLVRGGIQWSKVPFPLLCMPATNLSYVIQDQTFQLIRNMEFLNDRFVSADIGWDLNGKIFNRLPLIRRLKWREYIAVKCLWGKLSDKNNPYLEQNAGSSQLMAFPEGCYVMDSKRPYFEIALGIHNIFKILQVEYVRRLNYNDLPGVHRWGLRYTFRMTF